MTGNDLIVAAPWIIFGAGLSAVWIRLLRARHATRYRPERSPPPSPDPGGSGRAAPQRAPAGQETISRSYTQEAQCSKKNPEDQRK